MTDQTPRLKLPFMSTSQVNKELTFNELAAMVDALVGAAAKDKDLNAPPSSPVDGDTYIISTAPTGAWAGKAKHLAIYVGGWHFVEPNAGWLVWVIDEAKFYRYDQATTSWVATVAIPIERLSELTDVDLTLTSGTDGYRLIWDNDTLKFTLAPPELPSTTGQDGKTLTVVGTTPTWVDMAEAIRDTIGACLTAGTGINIAVNDAGNTITISATSTIDAEVIRDTIGSALVAGTNVTIDVDDTANTITINATGGGGGSASYPSFTGNANKVLAVLADETGVHWITAPSGSGSSGIPSGGGAYAAQTQVIQYAGGRVGGGGSISLSLPAPTTAGNRLLLVYTGGTSPNVVPGWSQAVPFQVSGTQCAAVWTKEATATTEATTVSNSDNGQWIMYELSNADFIDIKTQWQNIGSSYELFAPACPAPGGLSILALQNDSGGDVAFNTTAGVTEAYNATGTGGNHKGAFAHTTNGFGGKVNVTTADAVAYTTVIHVGPKPSVIAGTGTVELPGFAPPLVDDFPTTVIASGITMTKANTRSGLGIRVSGAPTTDGYLGMVLRPKPGTTAWSFTAKLSPVASVNFAGSGIVVRNSTTGKLYTFQFTRGGTYDLLEVVAWNSETSYVATPAGVRAPISAPYIRISGDAATLYFAYSPDGINWIELLTPSLSAHIGSVDQIGLVMVQQTSIPIAAVFDWFEASDLPARTVTVGGGSLATLSDVDVLTDVPSDGEALVWSNTFGKWVPGSVARTPMSGLPTSGARYWRIRALALPLELYDGWGAAAVTYRNAAGTALSGSGTASASQTDTGGGWAASEAFNGSLASGNGWYSGADGLGSTLNYDFGSAVSPATVEFAPLTGFAWSMPTTVAIDYSTDNTVWRQLATYNLATGEDNTLQVLQLDLDTGSGSGGGGSSTGGAGGFSVLDTLYKTIAEANTAMTAVAGGTLFDKIVDLGGFVIIALCGTVNETSRNAANVYTVPTGKKAVVVDVFSDAQTGSGNVTFYKAKLNNTTTSTAMASPNAANLASGVNKAFRNATGGANGGSLASNAYDVNATVPLPPIAATSGQVLRAEIGSANDGNYRPVFSYYILAIVDATTNVLEPVYSPEGSVASSGAVGAHRYWRLIMQSVAGTNVQMQALAFYNATTRIMPTSFSASSQYDSSYGPANMLDDTGSYWAAGGNMAWLAATFASPVAITSIQMQPVAAALSQAPFEYEVQYSDDGVSWRSVPGKYAVPASGYAAATWYTYELPSLLYENVLSLDNILTISGTARNLAATDVGKYLRFTNAAASTFTVLDEATVAAPIGAVIEFEQAGTGSLTIAAGAGVTINSRGADLTLAGQFSTAFLKKVGSNTWTLGGDL